MGEKYAYEIEIDIFKNNLKNYGKYIEKVKRLDLDIEALENNIYGIKSTSLIKKGSGSTNPQNKINAKYGQLKKLENLKTEKSEILLKIADIEKILKKIPNDCFKSALIDIYAYEMRYEDAIKKYDIAYSVNGLFKCFDRLIIDALKKKGSSKK